MIILSEIKQKKKPRGHHFLSFKVGAFWSFHFQLGENMLATTQFCQKMT